MTAATMPPDGATLAEIVQAAGDERRPPPAARRAPLIGAIVVAAALHAGAAVLAWQATQQARGGEPEVPIAVELVMEAPPVGAGGATSGTAEPDQDSQPVADVPPAKADVSVPDATAASSRPPAKPKAPAKVTVAPRRQVKRTASPAAATPTQDEAPKPSSADARSDAPSPSTEPAAVANPGGAASAADGVAEPGRGSGGAASAGRAGAGTTVAGAERARILDAYGRVLWARIAAHKPKGLRLVGRTGVSFTVAADGSLLAARIAQPSGNEELNLLALQAVRAAAPFPPPPPAVVGTQPLTFDIPFAFR